MSWEVLAGRGRGGTIDLDGSKLGDVQPRWRRQ